MIHQAGIPREGVQRCTRCDVILMDCRGMMQLDDDPINGPRYWPVLAGVEVVQDGADGPRFSGVSTDKPDCERTH
jgi:hypothetical protein